MHEREAELIDYLRVLWRQKWVIVITFIAAVAAAWGASHAIAPSYRANTSLLMLPPLSGQLGGETSGGILTPGAYEELAVSTSLLQRVSEALEPRVSVTAGSLKSRLSVSVEPLGSEGELLLRATVRGPDADVLPDIARAWTTAFSNTYEELFRDRITRLYDYVNKNYADAEAELTQLTEERTQLLLDHPPSTLLAERNELQQEWSRNESNLAASRRDRDTTAALIAALEEELALQPFSYTLRSTIDPNSLAGALAAGLSAREIDALMNIQVETEQLNDTYIGLASQIASRRASLRELEEEIRVREEDAITLRVALDAAQRELTETEATQGDLDRRIGLAQAAYTQLAADLQDAQAALTGSPEPIRVIDEPVATAHSNASRMPRNMAAAGVLGLIVGALLAFFVDYLARVHERESASRRPVPVKRPGSDRLRGRQADEEARSPSEENRSNP